MRRRAWGIAPHPLGLPREDGIFDSIQKGEGAKPLTTELVRLGERAENVSHLLPKPPSQPSARATPPYGKKEEAAVPFYLPTAAATTPETPAWQGLGGVFQRPRACANQAL